MSLRGSRDARRQGVSVAGVQCTCVLLGRRFICFYTSSWADGEKVLRQVFQIIDIHIPALSSLALCEILHTHWLL